MAKKALINPDLFAKTEARPEYKTDTQAEAGPRKRRKRDANNPVISYGMGLRSGDWRKFFDIAETLGTNYHDLGVFVLLDFMARWDKGYRPPTETKTVLKRP